MNSSSFELSDLPPQTSIYIYGGHNSGKTYLKNNIVYVLKKIYDLPLSDLPTEPCVLSKSITFIDDNYIAVDYKYLNKILSEKKYHNIIIGLNPTFQVQTLRYFDFVFIQNNLTYIQKKYMSNIYNCNPLSENCEEIINNYDEKYGFIVVQKDKPLRTYCAENFKTYSTIYENNKLSYDIVSNLINKIENCTSIFHVPYCTFHNELLDKLTEIKKVHYILWCFKHNINFDTWLPLEIYYTILNKLFLIIKN